MSPFILQIQIHSSFILLPHLLKPWLCNNVLQCRKKLTVQGQCCITTILPLWWWGNLRERWGVWKIGKRILSNVSRSSELSKETRNSDLVAKSSNFHGSSNLKLCWANTCFIKHQSEVSWEKQNWRKVPWEGSGPRAFAWSGTSAWGSLCLESKAVRKL